MTETATTKPAITFGVQYRDRITGFIGTCIGKAQYISGCDQVLIVPPAKEGEYKEGIWIDDERLLVNETDEPVERTSSRGGPQQSPSKR